MSAPWSVRALAFARNVSLYVSICSDTGGGKGEDNEGDKRGTRGTEDETRMSSLDACLLDLGVQGLSLPLVTTP